MQELATMPFFFDFNPKTRYSGVFARLEENPSGVILPILLAQPIFHGF